MESVSGYCCIVYCHSPKAYFIYLFHVLCADHVSGVSGPAQKHDLHVWPRHLPAVWRPHERMSHLPQGHRAPHPPLLKPVLSPSLYLSTSKYCYYYKYFYTSDCHTASPSLAPLYLEIATVLPSLHSTDGFLLQKQ